MMETAADGFSEPRGKEKGAPLSEEGGWNLEDRARSTPGDTCSASDSASVRLVEENSRRDGVDDVWEFDAPQYFDFSVVLDEEVEREKSEAFFAKLALESTPNVKSCDTGGEEAVEVDSLQHQNDDTRTDAPSDHKELLDDADADKGKSLETTKPKTQKKARKVIPVTIPKSPKFHTSRRHERKTHNPVHEPKQPDFCNSTLKSSMKTSGMTRKTKVRDEKSKTIPHPFSFASEKRVRSKQTEQNTQRSTIVKNFRPDNHAKFQPSRSMRALTERLSCPKSQENPTEISEEFFSFKARPLNPKVLAGAHVPKRSHSKEQKTTTTRVQEFSFTKRPANFFASKEKSTHQNSSQMLKSGSTASRNAPTVTVPKPFSLASESRVAARSQRKANAENSTTSRNFKKESFLKTHRIRTHPPEITKQAVAKQAEMERKQVDQIFKQFRARPMPDFSKGSMKLPTILSKPATRPVYKVLPSEIRAKDRKRFDEKREQHLRDLERQKLLKEKEEEKRALEIFEKVRFRARPFIPFPSPPHVRLSRKELTEPETPVFHSEKRVLSRSQKLRMASKILVTK